MIKIRVSPEKMKEIEEKHWNWFEEECLKNWIDEIIRNKEFRNIFFNEEEFNKWFDKKKRESSIKWKNRQKSDKFELFKKFIIGKEFFDLKVEISSKNKEYFIGQYDKFRSNKDNWGGNFLIKELDIKVCPYCNRNFMHVIQKNEEKLYSNSELDHIKPKSEYCYLALNLYNLIPVCHTCNHMKSNDEKELINPYNEEFGNSAKFSINLNNIEGVEEYKIKKYNPDVLAGNSDDFLIDIKFDENGELAEKIKNSIEIFKLKKVYQSHKDYIRELIRKAIVYNESRIDELFNEYEGSLFNSREDVVSMIVSNYIDDEDLDKRVLAKLTKDISEELGLK